VSPRTVCVHAQDGVSVTFDRSVEERWVMSSISQKEAKREVSVRFWQFNADLGGLSDSFDNNERIKPPK